METWTCGITSRNQFREPKLQVLRCNKIYRKSYYTQKSTPIKVTFRRDGTGNRKVTARSARSKDRVGNSSKLELRGKTRHLHVESLTKIVCTASIRWAKLTPKPTNRLNGSRKHRRGKTERPAFAKLGWNIIRTLLMSNSH